MQTILAPNASWPTWTPPKGRPHRELAPKRHRFFADLLRSITDTPGLTARRLADIHSMSTQHVNRRVNMLLDDGLIRVVYVKAPKKAPVSTFYAVEV